mgnify:CR=1 FL=1
MAAAILKFKSVKPYTMAVLETRNGNGGAPVKSEEVIVEKRDQLRITLLTDSGSFGLDANSVDATVFTSRYHPDVTFRLRTVEENVA